MPDISMCRNESCPIRTGCYRFMAVKSFRQFYAGYTPVKGVDGIECRGLIELRDDDVIRGGRKRSAE